MSQTRIHSPIAESLRRQEASASMHEMMDGEILDRDTGLLVV